jgi:hypothetical protein
LDLKRFSFWPGKQALEAANRNILLSPGFCGRRLAAVRLLVEAWISGALIARGPRWGDKKKAAVLSGEFPITEVVSLPG